MASCLSATRILAAIICVIPVPFALAHAECAVDTIVIKGRVGHAPANAKIHVQLLYAKKRGGDSAEATLQQHGKFDIPIEFLTQSRSLSVNGLFEKCDRKPEAVIITLIGGDSSQEYDRISLDFRKDFAKSDPSSYIPRSEIALKGPQ
ncbi:MAG: hypothetical protein WCF22_17090 [Candidatus Sulfotelmatobacter sp.]